MEQGAKATLLFFSSTESDPPNFGNPSSVHWAGRKVKSILDDSRESIAEAFGIADPEGIFFTSGATESINTAIKGFFFQYHPQESVRFISSAVEHEATLESLRFVERLGAEVQLLPVDREGQISLEELRQVLASSPKKTLVSLLAANNETGVIFPWEKAAELAHQHGALFHLDAVQAPGKIPHFSLGAIVDMASFSAHKIGGPKGVGLLYVKRGTKIESFFHGGPQEKKRRAGTQNVAGIASFGEAAKALQKRDLSAIQRRREELENRVRQDIPGTHVLGSTQPRLANTSYFLFDSVRGEALLMGLDLEGFAVSSGSACNSGSILPSHVLLAMGFDKSAASSAIRVSQGPSNTSAELNLFVEALKKVVGRIRSQG
jgi:cysteine desulfurase